MVLGAQGQQQQMVRTVGRAQRPPFTAAVAARARTLAAPPPQPVPAGFCEVRGSTGDDAVVVAQQLDNLIVADRDEVVAQQQQQQRAPAAVADDDIDEHAELSFLQRKWDANSRGGPGLTREEYFRLRYLTAKLDPPDWSHAFGLAHTPLAGTDDTERAAAAVTETTAGTAASAASTDDTTHTATSAAASTADVAVATVPARRGPPPPPRRHSPKKAAAAGYAGRTDETVADVDAFAKKAPARRRAVEIRVNLDVDSLRQLLTRFDAMGSDVETEDEAATAGKAEEEFVLSTVAEVAVTKARRPARRGRPATPPSADDQQQSTHSNKQQQPVSSSLDEQRSCSSSADEQLPVRSSSSSSDEQRDETMSTAADESAVIHAAAVVRSEDWQPCTSLNMVKLNSRFAEMKPVVAFGVGVPNQCDDLVEAIRSQRYGFKEALRTMCLDNDDWRLNTTARRLPSGLLVRVTTIMVYSGGFQSIGRGLQVLPPSPGKFAWPYAEDPRTIFGGKWFKVEDVTCAHPDYTLGPIAHVEELDELEDGVSMTQWHSWVLYDSDVAAGTEELRKILYGNDMRKLERVDDPRATPRPQDQRYFDLLDAHTKAREAVAVEEDEVMSSGEQGAAPENMVPENAGDASDDDVVAEDDKVMLSDEQVSDEDSVAEFSDEEIAHIASLDHQGEPDEDVANALGSLATPATNFVGDDDPDLYYDSDAGVMWWGTEDPNTGKFKKILGLSDAAAAVEEQAASRPRNLRGAACSVYWDGDKQWYVGKIISVKRDRSKVLVQYDDGSEEWEPLNKNLRLLDEVTPFCVASDCATVCGPEARIEDTQFQDPAAVALCYYELVSFCHEVQGVSQTAAVVVCCRQGLIRSAAIWIRMVAETTRKSPGALLNYLRKHYNKRVLNPKNMAAEVVYLPFAMGKDNF